LQLRVFRLGGDKNRNVGVGVLPKCQKLLVRDVRLGRVALEHVRAAKSEICERPENVIQHDAAME